MADSTSPRQQPKSSSSKSFTSGWRRSPLRPTQVGRLWWKSWLCLEDGKTYKTHEGVWEHYLNRHVRYITFKNEEAGYDD